MNSEEGQHVDGGSGGSQPATDDNPMDTLAAMMTKLKVREAHGHADGRVA